MEGSEKKQISITEVKSLIANGVTRKCNDKGYSEERKSIEEIYDLTKSEVTALFKHPKLVGLKVRVPVELSFDIVDDETEESPAIVDSVSYGQPSATAVERIQESPEPVAEAPVTPGNPEDLF